MPEAINEFVIPYSGLPVVTTDMVAAKLEQMRVDKKIVAKGISFQRKKVAEEHTFYKAVRFETVKEIGPYFSGVVSNGSHYLVGLAQPRTGTYNVFISKLERKELSDTLEDITAIQGNSGLITFAKSPAGIHLHTVKDTPSLCWAKGLGRSEDVYTDKLLSDILSLADAKVL